MDLKTISLSRQSHPSNINVKLTTIAFYSNYTKKYLLHLKEKTVLLLPSNLQMTHFEKNISVSASFIRIENERIENSGKAFRDVSLLLKPVDFQNDLKTISSHKS